MADVLAMLLQIYLDVSLVLVVVQSGTGTSLLQPGAHIDPKSNENLRPSASNLTFSMKASVNVSWKDCSCENPNNVNDFIELLKKECCSLATASIMSEWKYGSVRLTEYLKILKKWNCTEFQTDCRDRMFSVNEFTSLVYDHACNKTKFLSRCSHRLQQNGIIVTRPHLLNSSWNISELEFMASYRSLLDKDPPDACVQVAMYDIQERRDSIRGYVEVISTWFPMCDIIWCGADLTHVEKFGISPWICMDERCKTATILVIMLLCMISIVTFIFSVTTLLTFSLSTQYRHRLGVQGICRQLIAISDIMMSSIVSPTCAWTLYRLAHFGYISTDDILYPNAYSALFDIKRKGMKAFRSGESKTVFSSHYLNTVGFFSSIVLQWGLISLTIAAIDRFYIIRYPLRYSHNRARIIAMRAIVVCAIISIVISALPLFVTNWKYEFLSALIVVVRGDGADFCYFVTFAILLLFLWTMSILSCKMSFAHAGDRGATDFKHELRLTRTLIILVATYTIICIPLLIAISLIMVRINPIEDNNPQVILASKGIRVFVFSTLIFFLCSNIAEFMIHNMMSKSFRRATLQLPSRLAEMYRSVTDYFT